MLCVFDIARYGWRSEQTTSCHRNGKQPNEAKYAVYATNCRALKPKICDIMGSISWQTSRTRRHEMVNPNFWTSWNER